MRFYYIVAGGMVVIIGLLTFPTLHTLIDMVSTTGFLPLTSAAMIFMPYAFLGFAFWFFFKLIKG